MASSSISCTSEDHEDTSQSGSQSEEQDPSLTIPESVLTWRGDRAPGTRMLVFRVNSVKKLVSKPKRKPVQLINFVSRKGCRKNVAVEVNRLNIGQAKAKSKGQHQEEAQKNLEGRNGLCVVNGVDSSGEAREVETSDHRTTTPFLAADGVAKCTPGDVSNWGGVGKAELQDQKTSHDMGVSTQVGVPTQVSMAVERCEVKGKNTLSKHGLLQKKSKSKLKKAKSDASVMTEISFGTGTIPDMSNISHNPLSPSNHVPEGNHLSTFTSPPPNDHAHANNHTLSPPIPKEGYVHKGTSPKVLFRNGSFNGLMNGYALPEVTAALKARSLHQSEVRYADEATSEKKAPIPVPVKSKKDDFKHTLPGFTKQKRRRVMKKKLKHHKHPAGTGKRGTRSFLVSIPRVHYDTHLTAAGQANDLASPRGKSGTTTHRRRSEIQLLLDGDKPRGQRPSETEIPVFMAEEISKRSSPNTAGSNSVWLGSSTRKITPVEHFTYPLPSVTSPTKRTPPTGDSNGTSGSPLTHPVSNQRKRIFVSNSTEGASLAVLPDQPPPTKQPKVMMNSNPDQPPPTKQLKVMMNSNLGTALCRKESLTVEGAEENTTDISNTNSVVINEEEATGDSQPVVAAPPTPPQRSEDKDTPTTTTTTAYNAELVVFDSRGECLIKDGEYSILMQYCPPSNSKEGSVGLTTFEPLTWDTVFNGGMVRNVVGVLKNQWLM